MPPSDLAADTAVTRLGPEPGRYEATLPDAWSFLAPSGGVLMTVALRAMVAELADPALKLISASTLFCTPIAAGRLIVDVEILRRGNVAAQVRASLSSAGGEGPGLFVLATFARDREGPHLVDAKMPEVPLPDVAPRIEDRVPVPSRERAPIFANFEGRLARGHRFWESGWEAGEARFARWFRYKIPQMVDGTVDPLALPPIVDTMPPSLRQGLGPDAPPFDAPSLDLTIHFLDRTPSEWLLASSHTRLARAGYASAEIEIWGEDGTLCAYGTQTMILRKRRG
jgi:acyl-CoA thioesterase